jgi:hypothetical protein
MKPKVLSPRKEHNVDILRRNPRSVELGQDALQRPKPPSARAPAGTHVRQAKRKVVEDAEGFQSIIQRRRSPRRDAMVEDRDFEPEAPVKKAAKPKKIKVAKAPAPEPRPQIQEASASGEESAEDRQDPSDGPAIEAVEDSSGNEDVSGDVSGGTNAPLLFPESDSESSPPSCVRVKKYRASPLSLKKKPLPGRMKLKSRVLPCYPASEQEEAPLPRITNQGAAEAAKQGVLFSKNDTPPSSPEDIQATTPPETRRSGSFLRDIDPAVAVCRPGPVQYGRSGPSGPPILEQTLTLRETSVEGDCLFDSIRQALLMRQRCCDWAFQRPIPRDAYELRSRLCDFAAWNRDVQLPYGHNPTPLQVVQGDYISGAMPLRDYAWEALHHDAKADTSPGRSLSSYDDYIEAMRSPTAEGDELMVALASIYFGVRILVFGSRKSSAGERFWDVQADYHPPNVHRSRHLLLVHLPGHYQWAHPHRDDCFGQAAGRITGRIRFFASEWFESWTRLPRSFTPEAFAAAGRRWNVAGGGIETGDRPDAVIDGPAAREFLFNWPSPNDQDERLKVHQDPLFAAEALKRYKVGAEQIVQRLAEQGLCITLGDAAAALHFTRDTKTGDADVERAIEYLPGGVNNPLDVDSPPKLLLKGKRATLNLEKKKNTGGKAGLGGEKERSCTCPHEHHCPCPQRDATQNTEEERERNRAIGRQLADELQLKQTAVETIVALTGCEESIARATLERHLTQTKSMQQAVTACCCDLHPAARSQTFIEANLGEGVRPHTVRETAAHLARQQLEGRWGAQHQHDVLQTPVSELHPVNLNQRFLHDAAQHLNNHELGGLPASKRLAVATNRATRDQWESAIDQQTWKRDFNTPGMNTTLPIKPAPYMHSSPAVRMAAAREQLQEQQLGIQSPAVVVVGGGAARLPIWELGEESQQRGFYWSTKQHIQRAWRQYMVSEGMYAPRTFKSLISQQLVPTICAETNIPLADWDHISDRVLLEKIEARLKPKNSTDIINRLRELTISRDTNKGTLSQRYRLFAETYLQRLAEAQECGCEVSDSAIKQTFTRAVRQEPVLDSWMAEEKWTDVWEAHRRIVERLRDYDAWAVYDSMQRGVVQQHVQVPATNPPHVTITIPPPAQPANQPGQAAGQKRSWDGSKQHQNFINTLAQLVKATSNNTDGAPPPPARRDRETYGQRDDYRHPGLDARGLNWHTCTDHIRCREEPCTGLFCQICGFHGHTAKTCNKRLKQVPGINLHGYFQESKPNSPPVRYEGMYGNTGGAARPQHTFPPPPRANVTQTQDVSPSTPNLQTHASQQQFPHFVNSTQPAPSTASRTPVSRPHPDREERISRANQTNGGGGGGSAYDVNPSSQRDGQ